MPFKLMFISLRFEMATEKTPFVCKKKVYVVQIDKPVGLKKNPAADSFGRMNCLMVSSVKYTYRLITVITALVYFISNRQKRCALYMYIIYLYFFTQC